MKFDDLDTQMRAFETTNDLCVLPGIYMVARIDGRSFTRLTKEVHKFDAPFDVRFRDLMLDTVEYLMTEFQPIYGYTQSDEISILFSVNCDLFNRKHRKLNSVLAGSASAKFSLGLGAFACFDCRLCELPSKKFVVDYFRWRNEDAHRNALNAHCYWLLRKNGNSAKDATGSMMKLSTAQKNEILFQSGINFNDLPNWQKRGIGLYWEPFQKEGLNPKTGETMTATRWRVKRDLELPMKDAYSDFISALLKGCESAGVIGG
ncbi:MAG: tRNA(His) guanylyltransferase Thg1 family protein [Phycisphaerae bacterium]